MSYKFFTLKAGFVAKRGFSSCNEVWTTRCISRFNRKSAAGHRDICSDWRCHQNYCGTTIVSVSKRYPACCMEKT